MNFLFIHNNFPAQFALISETLARDSRHRVLAIGAASARDVSGVTLHRYALPPVDTAATHPFARRFDGESRRAEQVLYVLSELKSAGFQPDTVVAHCGWGESLGVRAIFPKARLITYCEFYYRATGLDVGFDPEFPDYGMDGLAGLHARNAATLLALTDSDAGLSPTRWQWSTFPKEFRSKIRVIHEGVDTDQLTSDPNAIFTLDDGRHLTASDEVVTFVARNLEPLRGAHIFLRAIPAVLRARPDAHILVIGGAGVSYGLQPPDDRSWRDIFLEEIADAPGLDRVHFVGFISYDRYVAALQISSAHVYYTYPFVLSWSLLEAMSCGCLIIASDTGPVTEVLGPSNGIVLPFFDSAALSEALIDVLARPGLFRVMRRLARATVLSRYDAKRVCLPRMLDFVLGDARGQRLADKHLVK